MNQQSQLAAFCPECGSPAPENGSVCLRCGRALPPAPVPQPQYRQPQYQQPQYQQPQYRQPQYRQPQYQQPQYQQSQYPQPQYPQPQYPQPQYRQPPVRPMPVAPQARPVEPGLSKKEFMDRYLPAKLKSNLKTYGIISYVLAGLNIVVSGGLLVGLGSLKILDNFGILWIVAEMFILLGLALGTHLGKSKVCAYIMLGYSGLGIIYSLISSGSLTGYGWLILGLGYVKLFSDCDKAYQQYLQTGTAQP